MQSYNHFTLSERENLRIKLSENKSLREIAREMCKNVSTISRELKRNSGPKGRYNAWYGNCAYLHRRKKCRRTLRILNDPDLVEFIKSKLSRYWSPEQIVLRWKKEHPGSKLSHSTIYSALKRKYLNGYNEHSNLLRRGRRKFCKGSINPVKPERNIAEWPDEIRFRSRIGDWEGDTIRGGVGKGYILTCVDRKSRYLAMALLPKSRIAIETTQAIYSALNTLPVCSLTFDNGTEFADYKSIEALFRAPVYFADPHSPWQRGTNENTNGLLRFFFPKGSDLRQITQDRLDEVADLLNTRPRKCLGGLSPADFLAKCCT
ncbi:MAG: IS30 family transposase [Clostridiales bacterium]|nr:IS30 family transposase [Clostridiales bacterium]